MQQRLALTRATREVHRLAVPLDLPDMAPHCLPALDLPRVFIHHSAANRVTAIPLEPAAWIVGVNPSLRTPEGQFLARVDPEEVERGVGSRSGRQPCMNEPALGKFGACVRHVPAPEDPELQHLLRGQLGLEFWIEIAPDRCSAGIAIVVLHLVVHDDQPNTLDHGDLPLNMRGVSPLGDHKVRHYAPKPALAPRADS
jgi:hypothetical protein